MKKFFIIIIYILLMVLLTIFLFHGDLKQNPEGRSIEINGISNNYIQSVAEESGVVSYVIKEFNDKFITKIGNIQYISTQSFEGTVTPLKGADGVLYFEINIKRKPISFIFFYGMILFNYLASYALFSSFSSKKN